MGYRTNSAVYAIVKEASFNAGGTYLTADVVEATSDTSLKPEIDAVERKSITNSFLMSPKLPGKESGSGTFGVELIPEEAGTDVNGKVILEVALGSVEEPGLGTGGFIGFSDAGITPASEIYEADVADTGTSTLYKLNKPCGTQDSLGIMQYLGCDATDSQLIEYTGIVPNSVTFDFPVADIATISFDVGASGFVTSELQAIPASSALTSNPYVGKNATFEVGGTVYEAKDLSFSIENTVSDREALTSAGITDKIITAKVVKGSLTVTFEDYTELDAFKNSADATCYLQMSSGAHKFAIYLPKIRYTSVGIEDDDGILVNKIEFEAYEDVNGEAILIAHE